MNRKKKTEEIKVRVTKEEKDFIKKRSEELGYRSMTAFLIESAKNHFIVDMDLSEYRKLTKEINYIGKNINMLMRHINTTGFYGKEDLNFILKNQEEIKEIVNKDYKEMIRFKKNFDSSKMTLKDKKKLIEQFKESELTVPKKILFDEVYNMIKEDVVYICDMIEKSPEQEEGVADYVYEYIFGETLFELEDDKLIEFADKIYLFTQRIKFKLVNPNACFSDEDWDDLKDILDEYEIY